MAFIWTVNVLGKKFKQWATAFIYQMPVGLDILNHN